MVFYVEMDGEHQSYNVYPSLQQVSPEILLHRASF